MSAASLEAAREAKAAREALLRWHECQECGERTGSYDESRTAEVWHWCPKTSPRRLVWFLVVS